jgi:hypothetical protein
MLNHFCATGVIPAELGQLVKLADLNINNNQLTGKFDEQ